MSSRRIEVLAPAGSYECFRAAIAAGADAVYAGGSKFGARAYAVNFTEDQLIQAIEESHLFGKRFYLTVNTLLKDEETSELYDYLEPLYEKGLDAVIVQDAGVFEYVRKFFPDMEIHASTQMTVAGFPGAAFLEQAGASRVVPARELSLQEIREIREHTDMEIECFVHGALCYCYSGQCLLSSMIGGRSGNRGQCAQPCRLPWTVNGTQKYYMSLKDMCTLDLIPDLAEAGIDSFKIEGRMKKPEYVAAVTSMYRKYTDLWTRYGREGFRVSQNDREILMDLYNRGGFKSGYYRQHNGPDMICTDRPNHAGVPAVRADIRRGRKIFGTALTDLGRGDVIELGSGKKDNYTIGTDIKKGEKLTFLLPRGAKAETGTVFPRTRNERLIQRLQHEVLSAKPQRKADGLLNLIPGSPALLTVSCGEYSCAVHSNGNVQIAENRPLDEEQLKKRLSKTGGTDFCFNRLEIHTEGQVFLPVQELNSMRREALEQLKSKIISSFYRPGRRDSIRHVRNGAPYSDIDGVADKGSALSVLVSTAEQLYEMEHYLTDRPSSSISRIYADICMENRFFTDRKFIRSLEKIRSLGKEIFPALPIVLRDIDRMRLEADINNFSEFPMDGILVRSYDEIGVLKRFGFDKNIILDHNLYVFNHLAKVFWTEYGITEFTAPTELNCRELKKLGLETGELIVFGYLPVMVSAQCIASTASGCMKKPGLLYMEDRFRNRYPVKNKCDSCYNVIYNSLPVYLGNRAEEISGVGAKRLRIQFSLESADQMAGILSLFENENTDESKKEEPGFAFTEGHFKKGIL